MIEIKFNLTPTRNSRSICVVDNQGGAYLPVAVKLSEIFSKVFYCIEQHNPFPTLPVAMIGIGYDNIILQNNLLDNFYMIDIYLFTDLGYSPAGKYLRSVGKGVWGATEANYLESDRQLFKKELSSVGLPIATTKYITGLSNLSNFLKTVNDKYIKISEYRGTYETWHHLNIKNSSVILDEIAYQNGPLAELLKFSIEDPLKSIAEVGTDSWCINGVMPNTIMFGLELKNSAYVGKKLNQKDLIDPVKVVNTKMEAILKKYNHTGQYSTEIRIAEDLKPYYTDMCCRFPSPPSNLELEIISNWGDIITQGVAGKIVEPIFKTNYGVELILKSSMTTEKYLPINFPKEYNNNIKLKGACIMDKQIYIIPFKKSANYELSEFGSVVCIDNDLEKAMSKAIEIAESIECLDVYYDKTAIETAKTEIEKVEETIKIKF